MNISGQILDADNVPLIGANITLKTGLKSGKVGTSTDFDGKFSLSSDEFTETDIFEISYIGFSSQRFEAKDLQNKKIILEESVNSLNEIVLVGVRNNQKNTENIKEKIKQNLVKNKLTYAGISGLLGLALLFISIKKLK
jgi:iron complex outermembrane recepter protein